MTVRDLIERLQSLAPDAMDLTVMTYTDLDIAPVIDVELHDEDVDGKRIRCARIIW